MAGHVVGSAGLLQRGLAGRGGASGRADRDGRTHIDVSVPADRAEARVAAILAAGGRLVDDSRAPMWWTVASPDNHGVDIAAWTDTYS